METIYVLLETDEDWDKVEDIVIYKYLDRQTVMFIDSLNRLVINIAKAYIESSETYMSDLDNLVIDDYQLYISLGGLYKDFIELKINTKLVMDVSINDGFKKPGRFVLLAYPEHKHYDFQSSFIDYRLRKIFREDLEKGNFVDLDDCINKLQNKAKNIIKIVNLRPTDSLLNDFEEFIKGIAYSMNKFSNLISASIDCISSLKEYLMYVYYVLDGCRKC